MILVKVVVRKSKEMVALACAGGLGKDLLNSKVKMAPAVIKLLNHYLM